MEKLVTLANANVSVDRQEMARRIALIRDPDERLAAAEAALVIWGPAPPTVSNAFKLTYREHPAAFVHECFTWNSQDEGPTNYQNEILDSLPIQKKIAVRGPHGLGKSAMCSWFILWFALTRDGEDWKVVTTASVYRQLKKYLWPEVHKWTRKLKWEVIQRVPFDTRTELLQNHLRLRTGEAFAVASENHEYIEGAHADSLLYIFDESKAIRPETFDAAEGAFSNTGVVSTSGVKSTNEAFALAVSTPGEPNGRFYDIHARRAGYEDWHARHVTLEEAMAAGRISPTWAEQRKRQWGEASALYQNRVLGQFCASEEDGVIPLAWIEAANNRWREWDDLVKETGANPLIFTAVGADIARGGGNLTSLALRFQMTITELRRTAHAKTMATAGVIKGIVEANGGYSVIDVVGLGAGVFDRLQELGSPTLPFSAGKAAKDREKRVIRDKTGEQEFVDLRAAAWWNLRELLDPESDNNVALIPDDLLTGDLTAPRWRIVSGGKIRVEGKDDIEARIGRSTDDGDAVVMAFCPRNWIEEMIVEWGMDMIDL